MDNISSTLIKSLVKNKGKTLAQTQLEKILDTDIHESSLGCKISNTHIRIGKVHLDTFYEAQLLFGNSYWTDVFSFYFYHFIKQKIRNNINLKNRPIILYGYETYSTLTLNKTLSLSEIVLESHISSYNVLKHPYEATLDRINISELLKSSYKFAMKCRKFCRNFVVKLSQPKFTLKIRKTF